MSQHDGMYDGFGFSEATNGMLNRYKINHESTYPTRKSDLKQFEGWVRDAEPGDVLDVGRNDIEDYIYWLAGEGYAPGTVYKKYYSVYTLYDDLAGRGEIDENPTENVEPKDYKGVMNTGTRKSEVTHEELTAITPEEKELLVEHAPTPKLRNELVLRLLWQTSVRQGELASVRLTDIDRENHSIRIRATKTHRNRLVGYQPSLDVLMNRWLDGGGRASYKYAHETDENGNKYLLLSERNPKMKAELNKIVKKAADNARIQEVLYTDQRGNPQHRITAHSFRHGSAVQCLRNGMNIRQLQLHLGHENIETTKRYLQMTQDEVVNAVHAYGAGTETA